MSTKKNPAAVALAKKRWAGKSDEEKAAVATALRAAARKKMTKAERSARARTAALAMHAKRRKKLASETTTE